MFITLENGWQQLEVPDPPALPPVPLFPVAAQSAPLFSSPGPDPSMLAVPAPPALPASPAPIAVVPFTTPQPAALPAPGRSWIDRALDEVNAALANGSAAFQDGENAGRDVRKITIPGLVQEAQGAASNVQKAAQLRDLLPLVLVLIGIVTGKSLLGLAAGAALFLVNEQKSVATS